MRAAIIRMFVQGIQWANFYPYSSGGTVEPHLKFHRGPRC